MHKYLGCVVLFLSILLLGCGKDPPSPRTAITTDNTPTKTPDAAGPETASWAPPAGSTGDDFALNAPELSAQQLYEQALLEAVDHLAERKYQQALDALEKARRHQDTEAVAREIDKVRAVLDAETAAERAVQDVKTVLDDGKAEEAARLAAEALNQYGGGDKADELAKLKQEADAVVTAAVDDTVVRTRSLKADADAAFRDNNLRAAVVALEQATALADDDRLGRQLSDVRAKLAVYDDNRARASELRRDPMRIEEAIACLNKARDAWPTLLVSQELDECQLILERRRERLSVADFETLGDVGAADAGRILARELLPLFRPRFDLVERSQISRVLNELNLEAQELVDSAQGRRELGRVARLRFLVVGSLSSLGGVTLHARLVEVNSGLIVQTARITAPTVEELVPKLPRVAIMLQMTDAQKVAYEEKIQKTAVVVIKPIESTPVVSLPPPPPPPAPTVRPPVAIVTYNPAPPPMGALVIEDFRRLPPVVVVPPEPPPALGLVFQQEDPRRHRLLRLSVELGDNCFRRGLFRDAQRHFSLALSLGGPRREVSLRLDACRNFVPPPPPPVVVVAPPPVIRPGLVVPQPVVYRPVVPVFRPRVAVFGFALYCRPGLVPPAASEVLADQFASYCGGSYDIIDRGEVCWYMGRLNLTMKDVMSDPVSRRCLAQALNARYFVFGAIQETASFDVETHLVDTETGARTGTGKIHVQDQQEMKLRVGELARQIGAKPADQAAMAKKSVESEKALVESRKVIASDPTRAAEIARAGLKENPDSTALQALVAEADRRARVAKLEADRQREAAAQAKAAAEAKRRQEALAKEVAAAKLKAEADAAARTAATQKQQQMQRERAAASLRAQAKQAEAKGEYARAIQHLQSASKLQATDDTFKDLARVTLAADNAKKQQAAADQKKREDDARALQLAAAKRVADEKAARDKVAAERKKVEDGRQQALHDGFLKQATDQMAKKEYAKALAAAESAQRARNTPEAQKLIHDAHDALELEKSKGAEKVAIEAARKKREEEDKKLQANQKAYSAAIKKGQDALVAKKYAEAEAAYGEAAKLFGTDAAKSGQKMAADLRAQEVKHAEEEKKAKADAAARDARVKEQVERGRKELGQKRYPAAVEAFAAAVKLAPTNAEAVALLKQAESARDAEKARKGVFDRYVASGKASAEKKQYAEAAKSFRAALGIEPDNAEAKRLLVDAEARAKAPPPVDPKMKERQDAYDKALKAARGHAKAGEHAAALRAFDQALAAMPNDAVATKERGEAVRLRDVAYTAAYGRGFTALKDKRFAEAEKAFDLALQIKPLDAAASKGKKEAAAGQKPPPVDPKMKDKAEADKKKLPAPPTKKEKDTKEEDFELAMSAGQAAMKAKNYQGAVNAYTQALRLKPDDKVATKERGDAVRLRDDAATALVKKADAALKAKKFADAVKLYDEALKVKPNDAAATKGKKEATEAQKK